MAQEFYIDLSGQLNSSETIKNINTELKNIQKQIDKIEIGGKLSDSVINDIVNQLKTLASNQNISQTGQKIGQQIGQGVSGGIKNTRSIIEKELLQALNNAKATGTGSPFSLIDDNTEDIIKEVTKVVNTLQSELNEVSKIRFTTNTSNGMEYLSKAIVEYTDATGRAISQTYRWQQVGTDIDIDGNETAIMGLVQGVTSYTQALSDSANAADRFANRQKKITADLTNTINQLNASATDPNASRSISNADNLETLKKKYEEIIAAINRMKNASAAEFSDEQINVQKLISEYKILRDQFKNSENVSTTLSADKLSEGINKARSKFAELSTLIKNSGVSSDKLTQNFQEAEKILQKADSELNASSIKEVFTYIQSAFAELNALKHIGISNTAIDKTKISAQSLREEIERTASLYTGLDQFNKSINNTDVSITSLVSELKTMESTGTGSVSLIAEKWRTFYNAAKDTGLIIENTNAKLKGFTAEKISGVIDNYNTGKISDNVDALISKLGRISADTPSINNAINSLTSSYQNLEKSILEYESVSNSDTVSLDTKEAAIRSLYSAYENMNTALRNATQINSYNNAIYMSNDAISSLISKLQNFSTKNSAITKKAKNDIRVWLNELQNASGVTKARGTEINQKLREVETTMRSMGRLGDSLLIKIKNAMTKYTTWFSSVTIVMRTMQAIKKGISEINELDNALVDLQKTTSMSKKELDTFYYRANDIAKEMGVTTKEIISQAAAWSRLGYSSADAVEKMSKYSSMFAAISPDMDVDQATNGLVSIMKAFNIGNDNPDDVLDGIMSKVNKIGNTAATSNGEIVDMLQRSSSAMAEANNTLEETIALETAAVEITRDADSVGTAYKTIAMRIRGYDEETEAYTNDIEELSGKIADLTKTASTPGGISLFTDSSKTEYKSTYQLLKEISEIYEDLTDKDQAALLEVLAGKRQGQIVAATLNNFSAVEKAMDNMANSAGSAEAEMDIIKESTAYKINELKQTWVGFFQEIAKRDDLKNIIQSFTNFSENFSNSFSKMSKPISLVLNDLTTVLELISKLNKATNGYLPYIVLFISKTRGLTAAIKAQNIAMEEQLVLSSKRLLLNPATWIIGGITLYTHINNKIKETKKNTEDLIETGKEALSAISSLKEENKESEKIVNELKDRYIELADGVENLGKRNQSQGKLSNDDYQEFLDISNKLAETFPSLTKHYDDNGNALINLSDNITDIVEKFDELIKKQKELNGIEIDKKMDDYFFLFKDESSKLNLEKESIDADKNYRNEIIEKILSAFEENNLQTRTNMLKDIYDTYDKAYIDDIMSHTSFEYSNLGFQTGSWLSNPEYLTEGSISVLRHELNSYTEAIESEAENSFKYIDSKIVDKNKEFVDNALLSFESSTFYKELTDENKEIFTQFIQSLDFNALTEKWESWDDAKAELFKVMRKLNNLVKGNGYSEDIQYIYETLLTIDEKDLTSKNVGAVKSMLKAVADALEIDEETLSIALGINIDNFEDKYKKWESKFNLNKPRTTKKDYDYYNAFEELFNTSDEDFKNFILDKLTIPEEIFKLEIEDIIKWVKDQYFEYRKIVAEINSVNITLPISTLKDEYSDFQDIYRDIHESVSVSAESFEKLTKAAEGIDGGKEALQEFREVLSTMPDDVNAQQEALNKYATFLLDNSGLLNNLTEENKEYTKSELKKIGVINAEEVVESRLLGSVDKITKAEESRLYILNDLKERIETTTDANEQKTLSELENKLVSTDLNNATIDEIALLIDEAEGLGYDTTALHNYIIQKIKANQTTLSVDGDIKNLALLAKQLGSTSDVLKWYADYKKAIEQGNDALAHEIEKGINAAVNSAIADAEAQYKNAQAEYDPSSLDEYNKGNKDSSKDSKETFDWVEVKIQRLEEEIARLEKTASNTYDLWINRNTALAGEISKTTEEINLQRLAYNRYMQEANSVGLSEDYASKVRAGKLDIESITDEDLKEKVKSYQEWYNKAVACNDQIQELNITLGELNKQKFDNVKQEFDDAISLIDNEADIVNAQISKIETAGYFISTKYYDKLVNYEKNKNSELRDEYSSLLSKFNEAMDSGSIKEGSQEWAAMVNEIYDVEKAIEESDTALIEFSNTIRELDFNKFKYLQERISQITQEANFLIDLMSNANLYNDNGSFTNEGWATAGLRMVDMNTYQEQALKYSQKRAEIEKALSNDPNNQKIRKEYEEILKLQQEAIKNADSEKQAIKSLVEEGFKTHLDYLNKMIDSYKKAMSEAKSLYEYQKNISKQTDNISKLEKILNAYSSDSSEETRRIIQQTQVELDDAREELAESEWDHYISATEELLTNMYDDYEEILNERLDNIDGLLTYIGDGINNNDSVINQTLSDISDNVGYKLTDSMKEIWTTGDGSVVTQFKQSFDDATVSVLTIIGNIWKTLDKTADIGTSVTDPYRAYFEKPHTTVDNTKSSNSGSSSSNNSSSTNSKNASTNTSTNTSSGDGKANLGDKVKVKANNKWYQTSYGGGLYGYSDNPRDVYITSYNPNGTHPYHISTGSTLGQGDLGWVKLDELLGYSIGSKNISKKQLAWTQEKGRELIYRSSDGAMLTPLSSGDKVFTKEMSDNLWNLAQGHNPNTMLDASIPQFRNDSIGNTINNSNAIAINLPNVHNYSEFKNALQNDSNFNKFVQQITIGQIAGQNSLKKNSYR